STATLRFSGVRAESSTVHRHHLTLWLSPSALTEWVGDPVEAFEIPAASLFGAELVEYPKGASGCVALVGTLHGRYVRWMIPTTNAAEIGALRAWVEALRGSR
ncbi:MAG: hypothetical protein WCK25_01390, partial [Actinomycetes bacterium]